jgi:hypothetical protein
MWTDFFKGYGNGNQTVPDHAILLHDNVEDIFFDDVKSGENTLVQTLTRHALGRFDKVHYADPVTPLKELHGNIELETQDQAVSADRFERMARDLNDRAGNASQNVNTTDTLQQITRVLESRDKRSMVMVGFIETYCLDHVNLVIIKKWLDNPKILHSCNLVLLICHNMIQLCSDIKSSSINKVAIPLPDASLYELYLRYQVHFLRQTQNKFEISNKADMVNACERFHLTLFQLRRLMIQSSVDGLRFDSAYITGHFTKGQGGYRNFCDVPDREILSLGEVMKSKVIDQDLAVEIVHKALMRKKASSQTGSKSIGVFLFAGPTGVGKTFFAKVLAELLYNSRDSLIVVDLSHYKHEGDISQLFGAAPNYVGFNEAGGWLTREVKKKSGGILLIDEIEKAHPEVLDSLLQMADEGQYRDNSTGETVSVSEFMLIMTSNLGTREAAGEQDASRKEKIVKVAIKGCLKPEFLNRIDAVVVFQSLSIKACCRIADNLLKEHLEDFKNTNIRFIYLDGLVKQIVEQGYDPEMNARPMARAINELVMSPLSQLILEKRINSGDTIKLDWSENKLKIIRTKAMS